MLITPPWLFRSFVDQKLPFFSHFVNFSQDLEQTSWPRMILSENKCGRWGHVCWARGDTFTVRVPTVFFGNQSFLQSQLVTGNSRVRNSEVDTTFPVRPFKTFLLSDTFQELRSGFHHLKPHSWDNNQLKVRQKNSPNGFCWPAIDWITPKSTDPPSGILTMLSLVHNGFFVNWFLLHLKFFVKHLWDGQEVVSSCWAWGSFDEQGTYMLTSEQKDCRFVPKWGGARFCSLHAVIKVCCYVRFNYKESKALMLPAHQQRPCKAFWGLLPLSTAVEKV